jgi:hypothetical protein
MSTTHGATARHRAPALLAAVALAGALFAGPAAHAFELVEYGPRTVGAFRSGKGDVAQRADELLNGFGRE